MKKIKLLGIFWMAAHLAFSQAPPVKDSCLQISSTLSLNGDTKLHVRSSCTIKKFTFRLYDKSGQLVYETTKLFDPLDLDMTEKVNGADRFPNGTYFWKATYSVLAYGQVHERYSDGALAIIH